MGKVFGISSYIILIAFITFIVAGYARANQTVTFLEEQKQHIYEEPKDLIIATLIANTQGQYDIYVQDEPVIFIEKDEPLYQYQLYIMSVLLYKNAQDYKYEVIILMTEYENTDVNAFVNDEALSLDITITFESNPNGLNQSVFNESFVQLYDDSMHMYALDQSYFLNTESEVRIQSIEINYPSLVSSVSLSRLIHRDVYTEKNINIPNVYDDDLIKFNETNLQLDQLEDRTSWYHNSQLTDGFLSLNYMGYLYIGIEFLIVIPITYIIFFRNNIKRLKHQKKEQT